MGYDQRRQRPKDAIARRLGFNLFEVALHEAAHALVAWVTGCPFEGISLVSDAEFARNARSPRPGTVLGNLHRRQRPHPDRDALIALAGDLAIRLHRGTPLGWSPCGNDLTAIENAVSLAVASGEDPDAYLDRLTSRAVLILGAYWDRLLDLTDALMERRSMTRAEVLDLLRSPRPSA